MSLNTYEEYVSTSHEWIAISKTEFDAMADARKKQDYIIQAMINTLNNTRYEVLEMIKGVWIRESSIKEAIELLELYGYPWKE